MKELIVVGETGKNKNTKVSMERYDLEKQKWLQGPETFNRPCRLRSRLLNTGEKVYMIGGWGYDRRKVDVFDLKHGNWSECSELSEEMSGRSWAAATFLDGDVYVSGGFLGIKSCEKLDQQSGHWIEIADMNQARYWHAMCAMDGKIYAVAGLSLRGYLASVECYSPETNSWTYIPPMSIKRSGPGVAALDGKLYAVGGVEENYLKSVEVFNAVEQKWNRLADLNVARRSPGVVIAENGLIYVAGGYEKKSKNLNSVEVYDPRIDTWTMLPKKMSRGKDYVSAAVIDWHLED